MPVRLTTFAMEAEDAPVVVALPGRLQAVQLLLELVDVRPELGALLEVPDEDDDEMLPHLLMSEVVGWVSEHREDSPETGSAVLRWMNYWYQHGSWYVQNMIQASGVEAIPNPGGRGAELRQLLSPALRLYDPWNPIWARKGPEGLPIMYSDSPDRIARSRVLVEPDELGLLLSGRHQVTLLDVRGSITGPPGRPQYEAGHLPGAVFVELETELSGTPGEGGRHPLPDPDAFQAAMRAAGVDDDVPVVVYDGATSLYAARLWWLLTDAGHPDVRVLDGGYAGWLAAGHPVETGAAPAVAPGGFVARPGRRDRVTVEQIVADPGAYTLVDVRAAERYRGEVEPIDPVAGHIPGALNRPAALLLDEGARFRSADEIAAAYAGVEAPVLYCGSGVTAAQALLALEAAGIEGARIYPGSWSEWIRDPDRPVATGEQPGDPLRSTGRGRRAEPGSASST